jgi:dipeptidyl aminopeptidase/acylaminoacyl peptidase
MTTERRLERDLPQILGDLAMGPYPDYIDDVLATTAHRRQRPAWTFPERWLPMVDIARQPVLTPRLPWRAIAVAAALIALLLATAAVLIGTQPRLPAPFGVARNGLIAYAADGDIYTVDPATGVTTAVLTGPESDLAPKFSLDGTQLVFERRPEGGGEGRLHVARADGTALTLLTPEAPFVLGEYAFSPDGQEVMFSSLVDGRSTISFANVDGSGVRTLDVGDMAASSPEYRPPDGKEIAFVGMAEGPATGLYIVGADGANPRPVVEPSNLVVDAPRWSPDGSRIAYTSWAVDFQTGGRLARVSIVSADGRGDRIVGPHPQAAIEGYPIWSNDGTRLFISRCISPDANVSDGACEAGYAVVPADGPGNGIDIDWVEPTIPEDIIHYHWAPDDQSILTSGLDAAGRPVMGSHLWDPMTGRSRPAQLTIGAATWQRLAP